MKKAFLALIGLLIVLPAYASSASIAVTPLQYDNLYKTLEELGYNYTNMTDEYNMTNYAFLSQFDVVFATSNAPATAYANQANWSVREFVRNGGTLYAANWAGAYVFEAFPGYIDFWGNYTFSQSLTGIEENASAWILDAGLRDFLGVSTTIIPLQNSLRAVINSTSANVTVLTRANITVDSPLNLTLMVKPITVRFEYGNGTVYYTTFYRDFIFDHWTGTPADATSQRFFRYLVLAPLTAGMAMSSSRTLSSCGFSVDKTIVGTLNQGGTTSFTQSVPGGRDITVILNWEGSTMNLSLYNPSGTLAASAQSNTPPIRVNASNAVAGNWTYNVTAIQADYSNYPYVATFGSKPLSAYTLLTFYTGWNLISIPLILT